MKNKYEKYALNKKIYYLYICKNNKNKTKLTHNLFPMKYYNKL